MRRRILITGGSGLLGLNWARAVRDRHDVILGLHARDVSVAGIQTRRMPLETIGQITAVIEDVQPHLVVHAAGFTNVEACEADPELARHVNVDLSGNVAEACAAKGIALVHISTDHLWSGEMACVDESCPLSPRNVYGRTKAEAERRVLEAHASALVVRTNFYGWGTSYRHSFSDWIIDGLRTRKELTLFRDVHFSPILAEALAITTHDLIEVGVHGIFHVVGDERISKYEFGQRLAKRFNLDAGQIRAVDLSSLTTSKVLRPKDMSLSNAKARALLGRDIGGVDAHLTRLLRQERETNVMEMRQL
jgi:dTDP-4-dehydrorhamnose reductase